MSSGSALAHQPPRRLDVRAGLARIAELEEERRPGRRPPAAAARASSICSTFVPFSIASSTVCEPDSAPIQTVSRAGVAQRVDLALAQQQVGAAEALERGHAPRRGSPPVGERADPARLEAEDVVDERDVVGRVRRSRSHASSAATFSGRADVVALAPDRLGAPVAVERAAARRRHVHREAAVARPGRAVAVDVDEVPGRERQRVEVLEVVAPAGGDRRAVGVRGRPARAWSRGSASARPLSRSSSSPSVTSPSPTITQSAPRSR